MLPKSLRLSRQGFENTRGLRRTVSPHFSISSVPTSKSGGSAIIVSKKAVKGAVARHLLKRRVRAILRPWSRNGQTLILSAKTGADKLPYSELENELSTALTAILSK